MLVLVVTKDITNRFDAGKIIKDIARMVGGSGGGRPDMAQAGGNNLKDLDKALESIYEIVKKTAST